MDKQMLAVHLQWIEDGGKLLEKITKAEVPVLISLVPNLFDKTMKTLEGKEICGPIHPSKNFYPDSVKDWIKENRENPFVDYVMEGYRHCCGICADERARNMEAGKGNYPDPHHEHLCLTGRSNTLEEDLKLMKDGLKLLTNLGISREKIIGYCSPNHLEGKETRNAARIMGFRYFIIRNAFDYLGRFAPSLSAWDEGGLTILPESKYPGRAPLLYIMYDALTEKILKDYREDSRTPEDISEIAVRMKPLRAGLNNWLLMRAKRKRDR